MSNYRSVAFEYHGRECAECGGTENIEVHHIDGDRRNNDPQNLLPLCQPCHRDVHRGNRKHLSDELKSREELVTSTISLQLMMSCGRSGKTRYPGPSDWTSVSKN